MGPSALRLQASFVRPNEGANIVGHVEELRPLRLVEGELSGTPVYGSSLSVASTRRTRRACSRATRISWPRNSMPWLQKLLDD